MARGEAKTLSCYGSPCGTHTNWQFNSFSTKHHQHYTSEKLDFAICAQGAAGNLRHKWVNEREELTLNLSIKSQLYTDIGHWSSAL